MRHHAVLAHELAVQAIRTKGKPGTRIGFAENIETAVPLIESPEHVKAAETSTRERNAPFLTVMLEGRYTEAYLKATGKDAPKFTDEDLKSSAARWILSVSTSTCRSMLASEKEPGWREVPFAKGHAKTPIANFPIGPEALYWAPKHVQSLWNAKEIFITENGCASEDVLAEDNQIYDTDRVMFMRAFMTQLQRATADGVPVKGYFYWSAMDNLEWTAGSGNRYGIVYVDFKTQKRIPKLSAQWFREAARPNAVV